MTGNELRQKQQQAQKAGFAAAEALISSGQKISAGAVNKAVNQATGDSKPKASAVNIYANAGRQQDRQQRLEVQRQNPVPAVPQKTAAQKRAEAKVLYDNYVQSDEYRQNLAAAEEKARTDRWMTAAITGSSDTIMQPIKDQKEQELRAMVDHYTAQVQQEESQALMDADLQELEGWDEADRAALETYIQNRNTDFANSMNPMLDPGFGTATMGASGLIQKYGLQRVNEMAESLTRSRNAQATQQADQAGRDGVNSGAMGALEHNALSIPAGAVGGMTGLFSYLQELGERSGRYPTMDPNSIGNLPSVYSGAVRDETAGNIEENIGGSGGKIASLGYQGLMSMADSYARMLMGGGAAGGATLAATNTFSQTMSEASAQGATPGQAALLATTKAGIEALSEKIPLDNLVNTAKVGGQDLTNILIDAFAQAGVEITTEEISLFGSVLADAAIMREKSAYKGVTAQELLMEAAETAVVSGISGGASSAGASLVGGALRPAANPAAPAAETQQKPENAAPAQQEAPAAPVQEQAPAQTPEEVAEQMGREAPKAAPKEKTEGELGIDRAYEATVGADKTSEQTERAEAAKQKETEKAAEKQRQKEVYESLKSAKREQSDLQKKIEKAERKLKETGKGSPARINQLKAQLEQQNDLVEQLENQNAYFSGDYAATVEDAVLEQREIFEAAREKAAQAIADHEAGKITDTELKAAQDAYNSAGAELHRLGNLTQEQYRADLAQVGLAADFSSAGNAERFRTLEETAEIKPEIHENNHYTNAADKTEDTDKYASPAQDAEDGAQQADTRKASTGKEQTVKGTGAAEQNFAGTAAYENLLSDDNVQRPRNNGARSDEVPKYDAEGRPVSEFVGNSMSSRITPDSFTTTIKQMVADGYGSHDVKSNDQSLREAAQAITDSGSIDECIDELRDVANAGRTSVQDVAKAELIYNHLVNQDSEEAQKMAAKTWVLLKQLATNSGRATQIFSVFQRMTPDSQCMVLEREVKLFTEKMKGKGHVPKDYVTRVDPELMKDYRKAAEAAKKAKTEDAKQEAMEQMSFIQDAVYQAEAAKMPATFKAKWDAWRYMCMLGNAKTQVRNFVGNAAFMPYKDVKDAIAAGLERIAVDKSQRTKAVLTLANEGDRQLLDWAKNDRKSEAVRNALEYSAKLGDDVSAEKLEKDLKVFDTKALESARKLIEAVPAKADLLFKNGYYDRSLAGFLKARGYTAADLQINTVPEAVLNEGRSYAIDEAMKATFNDCNAFSDFFASIGRNPAKKDNPFVKAFNVAAEGVLPFRRTPANIVVRFTEYSPVGLTKGVWDAATKIRNGEISAATAIDQMAAGVTGTAAMTLGFFLAKGIGGFKLRGSGTDEDEERQGHQDYSVEFSIDGKEYSYKIDWAAPANLPLFVGANLYDLMTGGGESDADVSKLTSFLYGTLTMFEPMLSLSCLSSLNDLFETGKYSDGNALYSVAAQIATSYITQGIPALARQAVQAGQEKQQTTFANAEDPLVRDLQRMGAQSGVMPWLKTDKVNAWGETEGQENGLLRTLNAFFNPGTLKEIDNSELEQEITRLNESQPDSVSPPETPKTISYTDATGERLTGHRLTEEEYNTLATVQGETAKGILDEVLKSETYAAMTDEQKASVFEYVYDYAREKGRTAALAGYEGLDGWMQGIEGNEVDAILDKAVTGAFTDAFEQLATDPEGAAAALDQAYELLDPHGITEWAKEAGGRTKYFIDAKRRGVDSQTFAGLYQQFREIDQNPDYNTGDKAAEWSYQLEKAQEAGTITKQQKDALKDSMVYYQMFPAETAKFDQMTEAGISADKAMDIGQLLDGIKPQEGYTNVRDVQKAGAIADSTSLSRSEKTAAMKIYLSDAQDENLDLMLGLGYGPEDYAAAYEIYSGESGKGKKARTINKLREEFGVDYSTAKQIYENYG